MSFTKNVPSVWKPRLAFSLPLLGYAFYALGALFGHPNLYWAFLLFLWSLVAGFLGWLLTRGRLTPILEKLDRRAALFVMTIIIAAGALVVTGTLLQARYFALGAHSEDTAYYSQILWNSLHGHFLSGNVQQARLYSPPAANDLVLHVSPILFVFLPIYALFPHFLTILIIRDLFLIAAAWPLFLLVRERTGGAAGLAAVVLYLVNPVVIAQSFEAFYLLQLAPFAFFWALRAFLRDEYLSFLCWMGIAISMREDVAITFAGFGLWALAKRCRFKWWAGALGFSILWWALATLLIQPVFGGWHSAGFQGALAGGHQGPLGTYKAMLTNPTWLWNALREGGLIYLYQVLRSVAFVPLLGVEGLIVVPNFLAILFLGRVLYSSTDPISHLALLPACAAIAATIAIVVHLARKYSWDARVFAIIMLLLFPSASLLDGAKNAAQARLETYTVHNDAPALREALTRIPPTASVAAPNYALPALSKRLTLFYLQYLRGSTVGTESKSEEIQSREKGRWFGVYPNPRPDYILLDDNLDRVTTNADLRARYLTLREELSRSKDYETVWKRGEYSLLRRISEAPVTPPLISSASSNCQEDPDFPRLAPSNAFLTAQCIEQRQNW